MGGSGYVLQYWNSTQNAWTALEYDGLTQPFDPSYDNLSLYLSGGQTLRLWLVGGPKDGYVSNSISFAGSAVPSEFTGYGYSWGMANSETGVMMPFVGFQIYDVSASAITYSGDQTVDVSSYITFEWYRVDPVTFELTLIPGASGTVYTTTMDDVGHYIAFRAVGDGIHVDGFLQQMIQTQVSMMNMGYVSDATSNGFTLHLEHSVQGLDDEHFTIYDQDGVPLVIESIVASNSGASYQVTFANSTVTTSYGISYTEGNWTVAFKLPFGGFAQVSEYYQVQLEVNPS